MTVIAGDNGSVSPSSVVVNENATTDITITPGSGYEISSVSGCAGSLSGNTYTTGSITSDCTVNASFTPIILSYTVTATAGDNGSVSPSSVVVNENATTDITITPDSGYEISSVSGCAGSLSGNTYTTGSITSDCTVSASFTPIILSYTVTATAGDNGSVSPSSVVVNENATTDITITPDSGYEISSVSGCAGSLSGNTYTTGSITSDCTVNASFTPIILSYTVTATAGDNGSVSPSSVVVNENATTDITITPDSGYEISSVSGCAGSLSGNTYTTGSITSDCTVSASFTPIILSYTVTATAGDNGSVSPSSVVVNENATTDITITPDSGYEISSVSGCAGSLSGNTYTTGSITSDCTVSAVFSLSTSPPASAAIPDLSFEQAKTFRFTWSDVSDATYYRLAENADGSSGFIQIGGDIPQATQLVDIYVPLHKRLSAQYILQSCNVNGCTDSTAISVSGTLATAVGYIKASNIDRSDLFVSGSINYRLAS